MCQACFEADAMFRRYLLERPDEGVKLTPEEADYYGFTRSSDGLWVDAWGDASFSAEPAEPAAR